MRDLVKRFIGARTVPIPKGSLGIARRKAAGNDPLLNSIPFCGPKAGLSQWVKDVEIHCVHMPLVFVTVQEPRPLDHKGHYPRWLSPPYPENVPLSGHEPALLAPGLAATLTSTIRTP